MFAENEIFYDVIFPTLNEQPRVTVTDINPYEPDDKFFEKLIHAGVLDPIHIQCNCDECDESE